MVKRPKLFTISHRAIVIAVDDIAFIPLTAEDVVRNRLVGEIVSAYGRFDDAKTPPARAIRSGSGDR